jgi:hypothetical protein
VVKPRQFSRSGYSARATGISCFPCYTGTRSILRISVPPRTFPPYAPRAVITRPRAASTCPARCSSTSSPA